MKFCVGLERTFDDVFVHLLFYCCFQFDQNFSLILSGFRNINRVFQGILVGFKALSINARDCHKTSLFLFVRSSVNGDTVKVFVLPKFEGTFTVNVVMEMFNHQKQSLLDAYQANQISLNELISQCSGAEEFAMEPYSYILKVSKKPGAKLVAGFVPKLFCKMITREGKNKALEKLNKLEDFQRIVHGWL